MSCALMGRCYFQTNKSFFSLPKIHKSWLSQPRHFIFTALKRDCVEDSVDYPECAKWWVTNKVCRRKSRRWEGLYLDFCTHTIPPIAALSGVQTMRRSHLYQIIGTLIPTLYFQRLSVPLQTSYPLLPYQSYTHLVSVSFRININIHLLSVKDYNRMKSPPLTECCHPP